MRAMWFLQKAIAVTGLPSGMKKQAMSGGFAIDLFNITGGNETACIDNVVIRELAP